MNPDALVFRKPEDPAQIAALHTASWQRWYRGIQSDDFLDDEAAGYLLEKWRLWLDVFDEKKLFLCGAYAGETLVGFSFARKTVEPVDGVFLDNLHVLPHLTRQGIGRKLISRTAAWTVERYPGLPLHLEAYEDNTLAVSIYHHLGGRVYHTYIEDNDYNPRPANNLCFIWDDPCVLI